MDELIPASPLGYHCGVADAAHDPAMHRAPARSKSALDRRTEART